MKPLILTGWLLQDFIESGVADLAIFFRPHDAIVSKLNLVQADISIGELMPERLLARQFPAIKIAGQQLELASAAWRPQSQQDWLGLLSEDLSAIPQLRPAVVALLDELPRSS